ncbi:putative hydrolase, alpha/beta fold protein [Mycolicibacterium madagascariense]|uniref:Putative hydrolase, alpha/beta fold protein n=1 Tax=Mycolicibacterium madagascariense TaxID=212765 RepID=A0A7I7XDN8_9MYCO|nr:alpha/beta fold hydrolase [Mycolicibacterium madagascariense]MCV7015232.1 alpha/beta fold hydrolase [Mycolicibacterium madagascariense]BBZ27525.1 putative hydrolase, alpha/beta fold protein [Mycolicibacterium madagascariense]
MADVISVFDEGWLEGVEDRKIRTRLGVIHVRLGGTPDGPVLLFWPSLMMDGTMWRYQYEHFKTRYRIILLDSPGHGQSDALRKNIDLKDSADVLVEVLDALGVDKIVLIGNSWGGMLAGVFPAYYPGRVHATIGMNATASLPTTYESIWATSLATFLSLHERMPKLIVTAATNAFAGPTARATRPEFLQFLSFPLRDDPKSVAWALRSILIGRRDEHSLLATITDTPVMIVAGEEDSQFPVHVVRRMAEAIPNGRFEIIKYTGHLAARENPDAVNALIDDFLSGLTL